MSTRDDIIKTINNFASPTSITNTLLKTICFGTPTIEAVRSFIIDPIASKSIPVFNACSVNETYHALRVMLDLYDKKHISKEVFSINESGKIDKLISEADNDINSWVYDSYYNYPDKNINFIIKLTKERFGNIIYVSYTKDSNKYTLNLKLQFIGIRARSIYDEFITSLEVFEKNIESGRNRKNERRITVRSIDKNGRPSYSYCTVPKTIILDHIGEELIDLLEMVERSEDISKNYEINKTIGVLLYGPAGTGKSTIARWLAMKLNRTLILTTPDSLEEAINEVKNRRTEKKYIMLIEDIDFMFTDRRKIGKSKENHDEDAPIDKEMNMKTNLLFQVLDGVLSNENLLVVATTNYIDRLDPALIRDGRFDFKIEVNGLDYDNAVKVCSRFDVNPNDINLSSWKEPISPASLQTVILKYKITGNIENNSIMKEEIENLKETK